MIVELVNKYTNAIEDSNEGVIVSQKYIGAVRLALRLALDELHAARQADIRHQDGVIADLLQDLDQLKAQTARDSAELLHLQTSEDRLMQWLVANRPEQAAKLTEDADITDVIIAVLSEPAKYSVTTAFNVVELPSVTLAPGLQTHTANGNGVHAATKHDSNFRFRGTNDELRQQAYAAIRDYANRLGRTPSMREYNSVCREYNLPTVDGIRKRLDGIGWADLCKAAGLTANKSFANSKEEDKAENAEAPFRG